MYSLFTKTLYDKRSFIIGWGLGMVFIGYLMTVFYPAFHQNNSIDELVKNLPPAFQGLVGNLNNLKELPSYLGSQLFNVRIPIFVSIMSIIIAIGLTVGEEEKGQLRTLISMPLSRTHVLMSKWLAIVFICLIATLATVVGIEFGLLFIKENLDYMVLVRLGSMMWLFAVALATIIFSIGLATGRRGITMGLGVLIAVGSFLLTTFAVSVDWLQPYEKFSILYYFPASDIAKGTYDISNVLVYLGLIIVSLLIGIICFRRRDVR